MQVVYRHLGRVQFFAFWVLFACICLSTGYLWGRSNSDCPATAYMDGSTGAAASFGLRPRPSQEARDKPE